MAKFTADEAIDALGTGEAIILDERAARKVCEYHGVDFVDWLSEGGELEGIDAGKLFIWLGY